MIAGEYAVLEAKQKAVVAAVDRYVTASIKPCTQNKLTLPQFGLHDITWAISDGEVQFSVSDARLNFIKNSISAASRFLQEKAVIQSPYQLQIESELDDSSSGKKYGLGSSAAVVVAVISAVLNFHSFGNEKSKLDDIFKLSTIAHVITQKSGSGADIAAAVYGDWLEYSAFSARWILNELEQEKKLTDIIEKPWPNLSIRKLNAPSMLQLAVGWTKEPAATAPMIRKIQNFKENNAEAYNEFLRESYASVARLVQGFETDDCTKAIDGLAQNRKALMKLGEDAGVDIETESLKSLCSIAEAFGSGKSSGAGGGDCGIAFLKDGDQVQELYKAWEEENIIPLNLRISKVGVSITK
jgi:phosphomevalonate kinase